MDQAGYVYLESGLKSKASNNTQNQLLLSYEDWEAKKKAEKGNGRGRGATSSDRGRGRGRGRGRSGGRGRGTGRGQASTSGVQGSSSYKKDRSQLQCFRCDALGHFSADCPTRRQEEVNQTQANADRPALLMAVGSHTQKELIYLTEDKVYPATHTPSQDEQSMWYLDNGASNHMTGDKGLFSKLDTKIGGNVRFGDGSCVDIEGRGTILLECKNGEHRLLTEVYYIPFLKSNIISLGQLTEGGCKILMKQDFLWLYEPDERLLMKVHRSTNRLYKISLKVGAPVCLHSKVDNPAWIWHARLGHANFDTIRRISMKEMVLGVPPINHPAQLCEACLAGKQTRHCFPDKTLFRSENPLDQIYADLCGPITPPSPAGNRYVLLIVDDHSRFMWTYILKTKDGAFEQFKMFKASVELQYGRKIKVLRTDRGGEFTSREFSLFCEQEGITRQLTAPYSPQQNGVVERRNRTVMNTTRSMLNAMKMPQHLWAAAVRHSVYVLNRLPTKFLNDQTPYEALNGRKPRMDHLRVFGCVGHVKIPSIQLRKLDKRSRPMVHLGIEPGSKAYRMYDVTEGKIVVSQDVEFDEAKSWSWEEEETNGNESRETEFVIHNQQDRPAQEETSNNSGTTEPNNPQSPTQTAPRSQMQSGPSSDTEEEDLSTPNVGIKGRGPMLPRTSTDKNHPSDPTMAEHETYDDTPPQGWKNLSEVYEDAPIQNEIYNLLLTDGEPRNFREATGNKEWDDAMKSEIASIERNKTWVLTDLPPGHRPIGLKWVFKIKRDATGTITKHKARLVAKGYIQQHGVDFDEVFAPVARLETVRLLLALAAQRGWEVHHLDVKSAFLHGELKEEVFVSQPEGFAVKGGEQKVYKLAKALYGLKQAPRAWNTKLDGVLRDCGFQRCKLEQAVYTKRTSDGLLVVGIYVDDLIVTGNKTEKIFQFKIQMEDNFEMSDLGLLSYYLGMEVSQGKDGIKVKQSSYAIKILKQAMMWECNPTKYPMEPGLKLSKMEGGNLIDPTEYRKMVGCLRYLTHTRPDLAYAVGYVSRYMQAPRLAHQQAVKQILRYVKGSTDLGIHYGFNGNDVLIGFSDSSFSVGIDDGKGTTGLVFFFDDAPIAWNSQKQPTVALSSCEAEFMAATSAACQAIWLKGLLAEITGRKEEQVVIKVDNKSAIALMKNPVFYGRSKHINTRYHFIRECVENNQVKVEHISGNYQRADILTKALLKVKFEEMRDLLGIKKLD
ncbi:hypothetical protein E3N88_26893 [Mikania micrantha]|uniref:Integrase catalytic domain-containing protein n=1 Tax=Mikania micrantha TaxID=192012 RepID=A0A5N6MY37_9ASTR|nr:hypothetical protein E3N88_26893 [Mikania micrantha]